MMPSGEEQKMANAMSAAPELDELKERMDRLEGEMVALKGDVQSVGLRQATSRLRHSNKVANRAVMVKVSGELGIPMHTDLTPEQIQEQMLADGLDPDQCLASRAIIAQREEVDR
jgi:hypothetical protein